jgi:ribonucleotide reductase alpha subunit
MATGGWIAVAAKVIPFPGKNFPSLPEIEAVVRKCLDELTGDGELVEHVSRRMMAYIEKYTFKTFSPTFNLPAPAMTDEQKRAFVAALDEGIDSIAEQVYAMVNEIVRERLLLEVAIYEERYGAKPADILGRVPAIYDALPAGHRQKVDYLTYHLRKPGLNPQEKYLLNKLLEAVLVEKAGLQLCESRQSSADK